MSAIKSMVLTALLASGPGFSLPAAADTPDVGKVLAAAEASLAEAREGGNSWTTTDKLIAAARQAGDQSQALELARRALLTADMAREQQKQEQAAWQARVPAK